MFELPAPVEVFYEAAAGAPLFLNFYEEFEEDTGSKQPFDFLTGGGSDSLEHLTLLADEDGLLALSFAVDCGSDFGYRELAVFSLFRGGRFFVFFDDDSGGVGNLLAGEEQDLLADELGDEETLRLVGELVFWKVALAVLQLGDYLVEEQIEALFFSRGDGDDVGKGMLRGPVCDQGEEVFPRNCVDLVQDKDDWAFEFFDQREGKVILGGRQFATGGGEFSLVRTRQTVGYVYEEEDGVTRFQSIVDFLHHAAVELGVGLVNSGGVDEDDLGCGMTGFAWAFFLERNLEDSVDAGSCGLRFVGYDCKLLPEKSIQQGRLARVRAADDRDESGAEGHFLIMLCCALRARFPVL